MDDVAFSPSGNGGRMLWSSFLWEWKRGNGVHIILVLIKLTASVCLRFPPRKLRALAV